MHQWRPNARMRLCACVEWIWIYAICECSKTPFAGRGSNNVSFPCPHFSVTVIKYLQCLTFYFVIQDNHFSGLSKSISYDHWVREFVFFYYSLWTFTHITFAILYLFWSVCPSTQMMSSFIFLWSQELSLWEIDSHSEGASLFKIKRQRLIFLFHSIALKAML